MTDIVIQNYDRASEVLLYSTETGPVEEKALPVNGFAPVLPDTISH
jgi:hypothetical protein